MLHNETTVWRSSLLVFLAFCCVQYKIDSKFKFSYKYQTSSLIN